MGAGKGRFGARVEGGGQSGSGAVDSAGKAASSMKNIASARKKGMEARV